MNRVGREAWRSGSCASRLRTYRHALRLVAAQRKRHGEFATGLDRELTRRTTALPQRGLCFGPCRLGLDGEAEAGDGGVEGGEEVGEQAAVDGEVVRRLC